MADRLTDGALLDLLLEPIRVCAHYRPKLGQGQRNGLNLNDFQRLYRADAFYAWLGLDNPLMYAAHKAAGGMTAIYRQIGIGCERVFRQCLKSCLDLDDDQVLWSYEVPAAGGGTRLLKLDGRIATGDIADAAKRTRFEAWLAAASDGAGIARGMAQGLRGAVFEVRQGYKSKDSKRQNADIANAANALAQGYLPCVLIMSEQIDGEVMRRYRERQWSVLVGVIEPADELRSTYAFLEKIIGYDLAGFLARNQEALRAEIDRQLRTLLSPNAA
jgi:hypothetical protein